MGDLYFKVHRSELVKAVDAALLATGSKEKFPALDNVLLKPHDNTLIVRGTNLDLEIEITCDLVEQGRDYGFTVNATALANIARNLPEAAELKFEAGKDKAQVSISAARSRYTLNIMEEADFPSIGGKPEFAFNISTAALCDMIGKVRYAIAKGDKTRPYFEGLLFNRLTDQRIEFVSCDGKNLAAVRLDFEAVEDFPQIIVPTKTVDAVAKLLSPLKSDCRININDFKISFECEGLSLISKLVDGRYPEYSRLIPQRDPSFVRADRDQFRRAIARTCAVTREASKDALKLSVSSDGLMLSLNSGVGESAAEPVEISYDGEAYEKGYNSAFLTKMLESISTPSVRMYGTDPSTGGHFTPDNDAAEDFIVMPMRVK
ncbi:DNA polymerase III subunit beta [Agrobacterium larrymoorei]|uniref:Beta sliding clamp n=1 Tax=Agrobacterium larrymoorei TaxID=160699 RepID=A0AAF0HAN4_9HYPH|nr:DNA polymerase III subunit beta [Agrobacterium larrymoorei]WHA40944.1 DNA polymerase III subunit beta [Agrobacterium larrymoorei]